MSFILFSYGNLLFINGRMNPGGLSEAKLHVCYFQRCLSLFANMFVSYNNI
jgi:hypothetical protein